MATLKALWYVLSKIQDVDLANSGWPCGASTLELIESYPEPDKMGRDLNEMICDCGARRFGS